MEKFWEDYHRMNTPSEDERAQEFWDDVDREIFGPDYKMIGGRLDIRGQNTESAASLATSAAPPAQPARELLCPDWRDSTIGASGSTARQRAAQPSGNTPLSIKTALAAAALAEIASGKKNKNSHKKSKSTSNNKSTKGKFASKVTKAMACLQNDEPRARSRSRSLSPTSP